ncbi:hypothetical protein [Ramlibacter sp.]|uniref:hypothetical protein n=1 Tax=Ramlibacter sp. TaxID=1917967 RepID=UPI002FC627D5
MRNILNPPLHLGLAEAFRRAGFRKWYERELLSSHAHLVLAFLSLVAVFAALEASRDGGPAERLVNLVYVLLSAAIGAWALRRYLFLLTRAEGVANQAQCESCGEYGRFKVVAPHGGSDEAEVCCRRCQHHWVISGLA